MPICFCMNNNSEQLSVTSVTSIFNVLVSDYSCSRSGVRHKIKTFLQLIENKKEKVNYQNDCKAQAELTRSMATERE